MDLSKVSSAPWVVEDAVSDDLETARTCRSINTPDGRLDGDNLIADAEVIAATRNALDIQLRRGWWAEPGKPGTAGEGHWFVYTYFGSYRVIVNRHDAPWPTDPATAILEAEKAQTC